MSYNCRLKQNATTQLGLWLSDSGIAVAHILALQASLGDLQAMLGVWKNDKNPHWKCMLNHYRLIPTTSTNLKSASGEFL
jgi:hypothetical protein